MQHQVQVIASTRAVATIGSPLAGMQAQYEATGREIVVYAYEEGTDYQQIATLTHAAADQVTATVRNAVAGRIAQTVFDAAVAAGALESGSLAVDADPMSLFQTDHVLGMTAQVSEIQVSYLPVYAAPIEFATEPDTTPVIIDRPLAPADPAPRIFDSAVGFVPQDAEAA
jgi:hypothetical protein